jgi:hypothetical protein
LEELWSYFCASADFDGMRLGRFPSMMWRGRAAAREQRARDRGAKTTAMRPHPSSEVLSRVKDLRHVHDDFDLSQMIDQVRKESFWLRRTRHHSSASAMHSAGDVQRRYIPVFEPESRWLTLWQLMIFTFVLTSAIVVPLMVAFEAEMRLSVRASFRVMDYFFDVTFIIDMLISCNVSYREDGFIVRVRKLILLRYLKGWLALDFVSSIPLSWIIEDGEDSTIANSADSQSAFEVAKINKLLRLVKLGKLLRILKLFKIFDRLANEMSFNPATFRLVGLAFGIFYIARAPLPAHPAPTRPRPALIARALPTPALSRRPCPSCVHSHSHSHVPALSLHPGAMCLHVSCHLADLFGCLWYMVISWSGGTLDDYAAQLAAQQQHGYENNATSASVLRGERYPFNELLAATELGPDGVTRKWLLCYVFAMGMFTGLMPIEMHPWREEEMIFCLVSLVIAMGPSRASFTPHATARTLLPTRLSPHATASQAATLGPRAAGSRCSSVRSAAFNTMTISSCSSAMSAMDSVARHHKAKLDRVRDFMRFNSVPIEVSNQVLDFYKYIAINSQTKDEYAPAVRPLATACTCPALPRRHIRR